MAVLRSTSIAVLIVLATPLLADEPTAKKVAPAIAAAPKKTLEAIDNEDAGLPVAVGVDLKEVVEPPAGPTILPQLPPEETLAPDTVTAEPVTKAPEPLQPLLISAKKVRSLPNTAKRLLGVEIPPATSTRLMWETSRSFSGMAVDTPVLVVNGANAGPTLCLTGAIHGDELNGIEMVRRIMYKLDPEKLHGAVIGVPIVNLLGFSRNSRYLPDRRDLNRYFPGNAHGSVASRLANTFFQDIIVHCNALVDLHTGSFYRTNIPQLRADISNPQVAEFVKLFGDIPVLNSAGNPNSLRAAAVRAGIPTVTLEAGEPMRLQTDMVEVGVEAITTLMAKNGMYSRLSIWADPAPAFYSSAWVRANASGILLSSMELGAEVEVGDVLGAVNNPITNEKYTIESPYAGRILGMALDQFVMPGFAVYHIGIHDEDGNPASELAAVVEDPLASEESEDGLQMPEEDGLDD